MAHLRPATPDDADATAAIARAAFQRYTERIGHPPRPMEANYAQLTRDGGMQVAELDGRVVGYVVVCDGNDHLLVDNIAVDPGAQGSGIGSRLLAFADDEARRRGFAMVKLYTNEKMTENIAYYPRRGFVETHRLEEHGFRRVFFEKKLP